ncbi:hypothetical protein QFL30_003445 [Klebsiella oxytoca]|nr:hypothetical protein [Klebsiella oxytoca]
MRPRCAATLQGLFTLFCNLLFQLDDFSAQTIHNTGNLRKLVVLAGNGALQFGYFVFETFNFCILGHL